MDESICIQGTNVVICFVKCLVSLQMLALSIQCIIYIVYSGDTLINDLFIHSFIHLLIKFETKNNVYCTIKTAKLGSFAGI